MKKNIIIGVFAYLFFMFLIYSGVFRDYTNPIVVTKYYFDCLKNREGFLTYKISKPDSFNDDRYAMLYSKYRLFLVKQVKPNLLGINNKYAYVEAKIFYKDNQIKSIIVELEKKDKIWKIRKGLE